MTRRRGASADTSSTSKAGALLGGQARAVSRASVTGPCSPEDTRLHQPTGVQVEETPEPALEVFAPGRGGEVGAGVGKSFAEVATDFDLAETAFRRWVRHARTHLADC